jgi:hypothetical protein
MYFGCLSLWRSKFFNHYQRATCDFFGKPSTKLSIKYDMPPFLVVIRQCKCVGWWLNLFSHHLTHPHHRMATKFFCCPRGHKGGWYYMCPLFLAMEKIQSPSEWWVSFTTWKGLSTLDINIKALSIQLYNKSFRTSIKLFTNLSNGEEKMNFPIPEKHQGP